jgi:hypothetical protein
MAEYGLTKRQQEAWMGQSRQTTEDVHENLRELLDWQFAERNDQAVAHALQSGQGVDAVYGLDDAGLLDGFFAFLEENGIKARWQTLTIAGVRHLFVPVLAFVLFAFGVARGCCSASHRVTPCQRCCSATWRP